MTRIRIPQLDANLIDVTVTAWKTAPGERVEKGDAIAELTTDKAVYELEAPESGEILRILAPEKSVVPTGYIAALSGVHGEKDPEAEAENNSIMAEYRGTPPGGEVLNRRIRRERIRATPKARRLARKNGIDIADIKKKTGVDLVDENAVKDFMQ
ncbi:MAG: biotin/lipoyl-containing protein [Kiritimatiellia bacterium]